MRRGHFILFFCFIFFGCLIGFGVRHYRNRVLSKERIEIEHAFVSASDVAAQKLALGANISLNERLENVSESFFATLSANLFLYEDEERATEAALYVPLLVVSDVEGFYLCVLERGDTPEGTMLVRRWTECMPYTYEDDQLMYRIYLDGRVRTVSKTNGEVVRTTYDEVKASAGLQSYYAQSKLFSSDEMYETIRRASVAASIESQVSAVLATQSYIAGTYGINISYTCPSFLSILPQEVEGTFIAIYQGMPSAIGTGYEHSGVRAASYIKEKSLYYVSEPRVGEHYRLAHKSGCEWLSEGSVGPVERDIAIVTYGCYGCPKCIGWQEGFVTPP